jgi:hypothetical protein
VAQLEVMRLEVARQEERANKIVDPRTNLLSRLNILQMESQEEFVGWNLEVH